MKKCLKTLVALLLALVCAFACTSCQLADLPTILGVLNGTSQPSEDELDSSYQIRLNYSYTYFENNRDKKANITVDTISVPTDNDGWTDELKQQVLSTVYNGYTFAEWYAEWDTTTQVGIGDPFAFPAGEITGNMTLYGERGNMAGPNVTWKIESAGTEKTLVFTGTGRMFDFQNANSIDLPWHEYLTDITKVVFEEGITTVGRNCLNGFEGVEEIEFASTITSIGDNAFYGTAITELKTPASLKSIGSNAFFSCQFLESVTFNSGLESIGSSAFQTSANITTLVVPTSLKSVGAAAFGKGSASTHKLSTIYYFGTEQQFDKINVGIGNEYFNMFPSVYYYYEPAPLETVKGPYWSYAKDADGQTTSIPMRLSYFVNYYLAGNSGTKTAIWTDYISATPVLDEHGNPVRDKNGIPEMQGIVGQENIDFFTNKKYHGYEFVTFENCLVLDQIITDNVSVNCSMYTTSTGSGNTFVGSGYVSDDGGIIWSYAGGKLTLSVNPDVVKKEGREPYRIWDFDNSTDAGALWLNNPGALASIQTLVLGEGIEYIGRYAFAGLVTIKSVVIPDSVKQIDYTAFDACTSLTSIYYQGTELDVCSVTDALKPDADAATLANCKFSNSNASIYAYTQAATAAPGSYWMQLDGGRIAWALSKINSDDAEDVAYSLAIGGNSEMVDFVWPSDAPWYNARDLITSVSFASNITSIGENALNGYSSVTSLSLPINLREIPASALAGTGVLNDLASYSGGLLIIDRYLLKVDPRIASSLVEVPNLTVAIAGGAFARCTGVEKVYLPNSVQYINSDAFDDSGITHIFSDGSLASWKNVAKHVELGIDTTVYFKSNSKPNNTAGNYWHKVNGAYTVWGCDHVWGDWFVSLAPTHTEDGVMMRVCEKDESHNQTLTIACPGEEHVFGDYIVEVPATCTHNAVEFSRCTVSGCPEFMSREIPDTYLGGEHILGEYVENHDYSCHALATKTARCINPDNPNCTYTHTVEIEGTLLPHDYSILTIDSGHECRSSSTITRHCSGEGCDAYLETVEINDNVKPHSWVSVVAPEYLAYRATIYAPELYYKSCEHCGICCVDSNNENDLDGERFATFANEGTELHYYDWSMDSLYTDTDVGPIYSSTNILLNTLGERYESGEPETDDKGVILNGISCAAIALRDRNKVLQLSRSIATISTMELINSNQSATSDDTVHIIDTMLNIGKYDNTDLAGKCVYQWNLTGVADNENEYFLSICFCDNNGNLDIKIGDTIVGAISINTWYNIRVEYYTLDNNAVVEEADDVVDEETDEETEPVVAKSIRIYIDGELVYSCDDYAPVYSEEAAVKSDNSFAIMQMVLADGFISGSILLDDTYLATVDRAFWQIPANSALPEDDSDDTPIETTPDNDFEDYDELTNPSTDGVLKNPADGITIVVKDPTFNEDATAHLYIQSGIVPDPKEAANKVLKIVNKQNSSPRKENYTAFDVIDNNDLAYVFEARLLVAEAGESIGRLVFTDDIARNNTFELDFGVLNGKICINDVYEGRDGLTDMVNTNVSLNQWFKLRIELYTLEMNGVYKVIANIYVNDEYVGSSDSAVADDDGWLVENSIHQAIFYHSKSADSEIYLDDVTVRGLDKSFVPCVVKDE